MPLPAEKLRIIKESIKESEKLLKDLEPEIEKARRAGIDITDRVKRARQLKLQLEKLKVVYL